MSWSGFAGPMGSGPEIYYHIECDFSAGAITYTALFPYTSSHLDSGNTTDINVSVYAGGTFLGTVTIKDTYTTWDVRNFRNTMSINGNTYYYDSNYMQRSFSGYSFPSGTYDLTFNFSRPSGSGTNLSGAGSITFPSVSSSGTGGGSSAVYTASFKIDGEIVDLKSFTDGGGVTVPSAPASSDWTETEEYILTPNANGGTVSGTGKTTVTKEYSNKFACWYSMSDGKEYQPGDTYSYPANTIMEAQYGASSPKNTYSHSFSGIFLNPPSNEDFTYCTLYINKNYGSSPNEVLAQIQARREYSFDGWYTAASGGTEFTSSSPAVNKNTTIYAHYTTSVYNIGSVYLPTLERDGYTLLGYSTSSSATTATYSPGSYYTPSSTSNVVFYAVWKNTSYSVGHSADLGTISVSKSYSATLSGYKLSRVSVKFAYSGTAVISSTGSGDTVGCLNTSTGFVSSTGMPSSYIAYNDDSGEGNNFSMTVTVTAGTTYYIFSKYYSSDSSGTFTVTVAPPPDPATINTVTYRENGTTTGTVKFVDGKSITLKKGSNIQTSAQAEYILTPNANGGTVSGTGKTIATTTIVTPFKNWISSSDSKEYAAGATYSYAYDTTMTAQYGDATSTTSYSHNFDEISIAPPKETTEDYCVVYIDCNYNGGDSSKYVITATNNYKFKGWYTSPSAGVVYTNTTPAVDSNTTIYAQYDKELVDVSSITFPQLSREGFVLLGFSVDASVTEATYLAGEEYSPTAASDVVFYAIWKEAPKGSYAYIKVGESFLPHEIYVYTNGAWVRCSPYIYIEEEYKLFGQGV